jgi:hypothetical protein
VSAAGSAVAAAPTTDLRIGSWRRPRIAATRATAGLRYPRIRPAGRRREHARSNRARG